MQAVRKFVWLVAVLGMTAGLSAQSITIGPSQPHVGAPVQVTYSNPQLAGQTVVVVASNGARNGDDYSFQIQLDSDGNGHGTWTCPNWAILHFNAPGVPEATRAVTGWNPIDAPIL